MGVKNESTEKKSQDMDIPRRRVVRVLETTPGGNRWAGWHSYTGVSKRGVRMRFCYKPFLQLAWEAP